MRGFSKILLLHKLSVIVGISIDLEHLLQVLPL